MSMFNDKGSKWAAGIAALLFGKQLWDEVGARFSSQTPAARPFTPTPMPEHVRAQLEANLWAKAPYGTGTPQQTVEPVHGDWQADENGEPVWTSGESLLSEAMNSTYMRGFIPLNPNDAAIGPEAGFTPPAPVIETKGLKGDVQLRPKKPAVTDANDARAKSRRYSTDYRDPRDIKAGRK